MNKKNMVNDFMERIEIIKKIFELTEKGELSNVTNYVEKLYCDELINYDELKLLLDVIIAYRDKLTNYLSMELN